MSSGCGQLAQAQQTLVFPLLGGGGCSQASGGPDGDPQGLTANRNPLLVRGRWAEPPWAREAQEVRLWPLLLLLF